MATIRPNDNAPAEDVTYSFPAGSFDLGPGSEHESDDHELLSSAAAHPWLTVEYPEVDEASIAPVNPFVPFDEDPLGGKNADVPFDPEAVREAEAAKRADYQPLAVEPQVEQDEPVVEGGIARTLAAFNDDKPADDGLEG